MSIKTSALLKELNNPAITEVAKFRYAGNTRTLQYDQVILEQPLQIRLTWQIDEHIESSSQVFSITMRTPGDDEALIVGLMLSEGIIRHYQDVASIAQEFDGDEHSELNQANLWEIKLKVGHIPDIKSLERFQVTYSSCGLCGSTSLKALELKNPPALCSKKAWLSSDTICKLPELMRKQQQQFIQTGGAHAAALFDAHGKLYDLKEDIGRHNALDKLLGCYLMNESDGHDQSQNNCILVSGRVSFEIVQKTVMAGIAVLIAVGAPSELAIQAAKRFNVTLIGFTSQSGFNLYHGDWRLLPLEE